MVEPDQITGLVLAGGEGRRLGGTDKGLIELAGQALAERALQRLAWQVGRVMLSANRHLEAYQRFGVPVWPDAPSPAGHQGPLAGILAGLLHCETPYLLTVPCDCPHFPSDLAQRLVQALAASDAEIAIAATSQGTERRLEPAFCLIPRTLAPSLQQFMAAGQRKIERWTAGHRRAEALFDDPAAFFNINTPEDLARA